jgi:hypothetical protein
MAKILRGRVTFIVLSGVKIAAEDEEKGECAETASGRPRSKQRVQQQIISEIMQLKKRKQRYIYI